MNPGKRRKIQKIEFIKKSVEENVKKLEQSIDKELIQIVVDNITVESNKEEKVLEEQVQVEEIKTVGRKKKLV